MTPTNTIAVVVTLVIFILVIWFPNGDESFISTPFSPIDDNIVIGNPISYSDRINPSINKNSFGPRASTIYHGHGVPLSYEDRPTKPLPQKSMVHLENYRCAPECCPGVYSCDKGCVCWEPKLFEDKPVAHSQRTGPIT